VTDAVSGEAVAFFSTETRDDLIFSVRIEQLDPNLPVLGFGVED
jgi:hypothetical protein